MDDAREGEEDEAAKLMGSILEAVPGLERTPVRSRLHRSFAQTSRDTKGKTENAQLLERAKQAVKTLTEVRRANDQRLQKLLKLQNYSIGTVGSRPSWVRRRYPSGDDTEVVNGQRALTVRLGSSPGDEGAGLCSNEGGRSVAVINTGKEVDSAAQESSEWKDSSAKRLPKTGLDNNKMETYGSNSSESRCQDEDRRHSSSAVADEEEKTKSSTRCVNEEQKLLRNKSVPKEVRALLRDAVPILKKGKRNNTDLDLEEEEPVCEQKTKGLQVTLHGGEEDGDFERVQEDLRSHKLAKSSKSKYISSSSAESFSDESKSPPRPSKSRKPQQKKSKPRTQKLTDDEDESPPRSRSSKSKQSKSKLLTKKYSDDDISPPRSSRSSKSQRGKSKPQTGCSFDGDFSASLSVKSSRYQHDKSKQQNKKCRDSDLNSGSGYENASPPRSSRTSRSQRGKSKQQTEVDSDDDVSQRKPRLKKTWAEDVDDEDASPPRSSRRSRSQRGKSKQQTEVDSDDEDASPPRSSRTSRFQRGRSKQQTEVDLDDEDTSREAPRPTASKRPHGGGKTQLHKHSENEDVSPPRSSKSSKSQQRSSESRAEKYLANEAILAPHKSRFSRSKPLQSKMVPKKRRHSEDEDVSPPQSSRTSKSQRRKSKQQTKEKMHTKRELSSGKIESSKERSETCEATGSGRTHQIASWYLSKPQMWDGEPRVRINGIDRRSGGPRRTSFISKRVSAMHVLTIKGSSVKLYGSLRGKQWDRSGWPPELHQHFRCGFPENWKAIVSSVSSDCGHTEADSTVMLDVSCWDAEQHEDDKPAKSVQADNRQHVVASADARRKVATAKRCAVMEEATNDTKDDDQEWNSWSEEDVARLERAVFSTTKTTARFWQCVAQKVGNHSAVECQVQYQQMDVDMKKKRTTTVVKKKPVALSSSQPPVLTAGRGTVKHKQQLRDMLEHNDRDYEDDFFTTQQTSSKSPKVVSRQRHSSSGDWSGSEQWDMSSPSRSAETSLCTDLLLQKPKEQKNTDRYINHLQKQPKRRQFQRKVEKSSSESEEDELPAQRRMSVVLRGKGNKLRELLARPDPDLDDDCVPDFYFTEDSEDDELP